MALVPFTIVDAPGQPGGYRYEGPLGPVTEQYDDRDAVTTIRGPHVPIATFALGSPQLETPAAVRRRLEEGIRGAVGSLVTEIRLAAEVRPRERHLDIQLGPADYRLVAAGLFPRVGLHRADLSQIAAYTLRGRRPHRVDPQALGAEVVLTVFLSRFVTRLAHLP